MKFIIGILVFFTCTIGLGQTTIHGYITYYESEDTSASMNKHYSDEVYNDLGERIYERFNVLNDQNKEVQISYFIGNTNNYVHELIIDSDTARYYYIDDTLNLKDYIISGTDTSMIYETEYQNELKIRSTCVSGCDYTDVYHYNSHGQVDTMLTIWQKGDTSYTIREYDEKNRQILFKNFLKYPNQKPSSQLRIVYDDSLNTRTEIHETSGWEKDKGITIYYLDDKNIPIKKEIIIISNGKKEQWLIEYQKE